MKFETTIESMNSFRSIPFLGLAAIALAHPASAVVIFQDDFSGGAGDLNGLAPTTRPGSETWTAAPIFNADGSVDRPASINQGSMTLPFVPQNGFIYNLDASLTGVNGNGNWLALGFSNGQSSDGVSDRFITDDVVGIAWMLLRGDTSSNTNQVHLGTGALGVGNGGIGATPWTALGNQSGGDVDLRISLDTTGGPGTWTATWYAKLASSDSYSEVSPTTLVGNEGNFTSIGIAAANSSLTAGTIESFSLEAVPEPSSAILGLLGSLCLLRRRR